VGAKALAAAEERNDNAGAAPAPTSGQHQVLLGLEEDLSGTLDRTVDPELLSVLAIKLPQEMNDPSPDVGRDKLDLAQAALFHGAQQLIGFA
jgi:hypothetical protein